MKKEKKPTKLQKLKEDLKAKQDAKKAKIRAIPSRSKRFWSWVWYWISFVWIYAFTVLRDPWNLLIFGLVVVTYSGSVWGFYLASLLTGWKSTDTGRWLMGIGTSVWVWWLSPAGSPFILLCVLTTLGLRVAIDSISAAIKKHKEHKNGRTTSITRESDQLSSSIGGESVIEGCDIHNPPNN